MLTEISSYEGVTTLKGFRVFHEATNLEVFGAVDDVWQNDKTSELHIVDYKSTSKKGDPSIDEGGSGEAYKRQMEIYQWLFGGWVTRPPVGYFLYVNGLKEGVSTTQKIRE